MLMLERAKNLTVTNVINHAAFRRITEVTSTSKRDIKIAVGSLKTSRHRQQRGFAVTGRALNIEFYDATASFSGLKKKKKHFPKLKRRTVPCPVMYDIACSALQ